MKCLGSGKGSGSGKASSADFSILFLLVAGMGDLIVSSNSSMSGFDNVLRL